MVRYMEDGRKQCSTDECHSQTRPDNGRCSMILRGVLLAIAALAVAWMNGTDRTYLNDKLLHDDDCCSV